MVHLSGFRLFLESHKQAIEAWCDTFKPDAIVLDPWSKVGPEDENDASSSLVCLQTIAGLQRQGIGVCVVCHTRKPQANQKVDIDQEVRGSSALTGAYDTHIALRRNDESSPLACIVRNKNSAGADHWLTWDIKTTLDAESGDEVIEKVSLSWAPRK
jgi:hypothetical protein